MGTGPGLVGLRSRTSGFGVVFGNEQPLDRFSFRPPVCPFMRSQAHLKDTFSLGLNFMEEAGRSSLWALGDACPGCTKELGGQPWVPEKNR